MNIFNLFHQKQAPPQKPDLIYRPDEIRYQHIDVPQISLTAKEAVHMGFSFHWKSKSVRITNYHGTAGELIIPSVIGDKKVNEISAKAFFGNQTVRHLQVPSGIKKIGKSAFQESRLENCLFADGMAYIPESAFQKCKFLSEVHLPWNVAEIRKNAFYGCKALKYIEFPMCCYRYADGAFTDSGLEGFGYEKSDYRVKNGLAFTGTPLWDSYALILSENRPDRMDILMVGRKTAEAEFQIPAGNVYFGPNAFTGKNGFYLDLTKCKEIEFFQSFSREFSIYHSYYHSLLTSLRFPEHYQKRVQIPCTMVATYLGKQKATPPLSVEYHDGVMTVWDCCRLNETDIPDTETLIIKGANKNFLQFIENDTFKHWRLKEVIVEVPFHALGNPFSKRCISFHKMQWTEKDQIITKYIPPAELVWDTVHSELLKAFVPVENYFFDSRLILDIFQRKSITIPDWDGSVHCFNLHARQKLFIAIDALRSTQRNCDVDTDIYLTYLKRHIGKARQVCEKVSRAYPEYLEFLNSSPFGKDIN